MIGKGIYRLMAIVGLCMWVSLSYAQNNMMTSYPTSVKTHVEAGDKILANTSIDIRDIISANEQYRKAFEKDSSSLAVQYRYAYTILRLKDKSKLDWALPILWNVATNYSDANDTLWYYLGYIYMEKWLAAQDINRVRVKNIHKDTAILCLNNQLKVNTRSDYVKKVEKAKQELANAEKALANKELGLVENYKAINSKLDDFNPQFTDKEKYIIYSSYRKNLSDTTYAYGGGKSYIFAVADTNLTIRPMNNYSSLITSNQYEANAFLANYDGDVYEFNENIKKRNKIEKPIQPITSEAFIELNATYADDGNTIYFASNCPKDFYTLSPKQQKKVSADQAKDFDIYKITRTLKQTKKGKPQKEKWGNVTRVTDVNSDYDELLFTQNQLAGETIFYLVSNNENSIGGYDIFYVKTHKKSFEKPVNIGYPINSIGDETSFIVNQSGKDMYLTSDRIDGVGCLDIYHVELLDPTTIQHNFAELTTKVVDKDGKPLSGANVIVKGVLSDEVDVPEDLMPYVKDEQIDGSPRQVFEITGTSDENGEIVLNLPENTTFNIALTKDKYMNLEDIITTPSGKGKISKNMVLNAIEKNAVFVLNNIFFDYDKYSLREESNKELENVLGLMKEYPQMEIELSGHTDGKGTDAYNDKLSTNRAKAVVDWLVAHGVSAKRLSSKGYGAKKPIATNDTDEGRQMNRRVEMKIKKVE